MAFMRVDQTRVSRNDGFNAWMNTGVGLGFRPRFYVFPLIRVLVCVFFNCSLVFGPLLNKIRWPKKITWRFLKHKS